MSETSENSLKWFLSTYALYIITINIFLYFLIFFILFSSAKNDHSILFVNTFLNNKYTEIIFKIVGYIGFPFPL